MSGGGGSSQSESQPPPVGFLNPFGGVLQNLFGVPTRVLPDREGGGIGVGDPDGKGGFVNFAEQIFGPTDFSSIRDLLLPQNLGTGGALQALSGQQQSVADIQDFLQGNVLGAAREGIDTGFRTDLDPIRRQAERQFSERDVPLIKENFAAQTGSFSTDFLNSITQGAAQLETDLGALQFQADEAAANRRTDLLPLAGTIAQGVGQIPLELGFQGLNLGEQVTLDTTPGGRALTLGQILAGLQPTSAIPRGNISSSSSKQGQGGI